MTIQEIKREIGKRLGDLKLQNLRAVAGEYFIEALSNILMGDNYTPAEIPELVIPTIHQLSLSGGYGEIDTTAMEILRVHSVTVNPIINAGREFIVRWITPQFAEKVKISDVLKPALDELYVYQENNIIKVITLRKTQPRFKVTIINIKYPKSDNWAEQDLTSTLKYSPRIIDAAISGAVNLIRGQNDAK